RPPPPGRPGDKGAQAPWRSPAPGGRGGPGRCPGRSQPSEPSRTPFRSRGTAGGASCRGRPRLLGSLS
ncbi:hypothetical protein MC885_018376, partial [Smutsia gigantea]